MTIPREYAATALDVAGWMLVSCPWLSIPAALNKAPDSRALANPFFWTSTRLVATPAATTDPQGNLLATELDKPAGSSGLEAYSEGLIDLPAGSYLICVAMKAGDSQFSGIHVLPESGLFVNSLGGGGFDLVNGISNGWAAAEGDVSTPWGTDGIGMEDLGGGWWCCKVHVNVATPQTIRVRLHPSDISSLNGRPDLAVIGHVFVCQAQIFAVDPATAMPARPAFDVTWYNPISPLPWDLVVETSGGIDAGLNQYRARSGNVIGVDTAQIFAVVSERKFGQPAMDTLDDWKHSGSIAIDLYLRTITGELIEAATRRCRNLVSGIIRELEAQRGQPITGSPGYGAFHNFYAEIESLIVQDETGALLEWIEATILLTWQSP